MCDVIAGYEAAAPKLRKAYDAVCSRTLLAPVQDLLPASPARVLDVGAGSGRDAVWFAQQGYLVHAVDPVPALSCQNRGHPCVTWIEDRLPHLNAVTGSFDCIMVLGVWQHLSETQRQASLPRLYALLAPRGIVVLSLRHGSGHPDRPVFDIDLDHLKSQADHHGFECAHEQGTASAQSKNRSAGVRWTWIVLKRRD
ncbi:class I SAM-dependent methyltransferase [Ascidiaceihabitans sp.]|uniref:class I SAM-dependent methyltransferase n=1 Tax=Ascidiaceihabitans sp. TaxID=1872644 RepID=UPI003296AA74